MEYFVKKGSIVREIWSKADTIIFIFAGSAAEFALNKAVDWLYFTGRIPADPIGRLFSTVTYARKIVFSETDAAHQAIDQITAIHSAVENSRNAKIPEWAYRDVLFMLIDYSVRAFELLERELTAIEKEEIFEVFSRMGKRMHITGLPADYAAWQAMRTEHLVQNFSYSPLTKDLYLQYRKHLGPLRYWLLRQVQAALVPPQVNQMLGLGRGRLLTPILFVYKMSRTFKLQRAARGLLLPQAYKAQVEGLDSKFVPGEKALAQHQNYE